ncbi:MAG TPA: hypothetical protein VEQ12_02510, partial [Candidatus Limnocylindria bacterium]|nr:hypothetical protein [Candidatus Limnocylindria bacterium]
MSTPKGPEDVQHLAAEVGRLFGLYHEQADRLLTQVKGVPVVAVSGLVGTGLDHLMKAVTDIHALWN